MVETKFNNSSGFLSLNKILMFIICAKGRYRCLVSLMNFFKELYFEQWTYRSLLELVFDGFYSGEKWFSPNSVHHVKLLSLEWPIGKYPEKNSRHF